MNHIPPNSTETDSKTYHPLKLCANLGNSGTNKDFSQMIKDNQSEKALAGGISKILPCRISSRKK